MVAMPMAQYDCMEVLWLKFQNIHVVQSTVVSRPRVKENYLFFPLIVDGDKHRDAVLGSQARTRKHITPQRGSVSDGRACHEHVYCIVHYGEDGEDFDLIHNL